MQKGGIVLNRRDEIIQRATRAIDVPGDLLTNTPLLEVYGNCRVLIENHHGVTGYTCCEISVCTDLGAYAIYGSQLEIVNMTKHRLVITGTIESVVLKCRR